RTLGRPFISGFGSEGLGQCLMQQLSPRVLKTCQAFMPSDVCLSLVFEAALELSSVHVYSARRQHLKSCSAVSQFPILNNPPVSTCRFVAFRRPTRSKAVLAIIGCELHLRTTWSVSCLPNPREKCHRLEPTFVRDPGIYRRDACKRGSGIPPDYQCDF